ncbi:PAS domain-containing sensor histidine kinase [Nitrosomonas aestuarii]|uniref:PAS domain-containing sensor histidine kinase n=1 Tax=Nitrosomonas aestuarii TaxID=52441 RepID=UPI001FD30872|nr:PAS domain-containing sensor histidine kinase [Nitrosomonas aestuarii]
MANKKSNIDHSLKEPLCGADCRELFDTVTEPMLLVSESGQIVLANPAAQQVVGYVQSELIGLNVEELIPLRFREHHRQYRRQYFAQPRKRSMGNGEGLVLLNRSGQEIDVELGLNSITLNKQVYTLLTLNVLVQHSQAENALRESEERLWLIKQSAGVGVFDIDCMRDRVYCDERMRELLWYEADEIMSLEALLNKIHPNDRPRCQAALDEAASPARDGLCRIEFRVVQSKNLEERWIAALGQTQFEKGTAKRIVAIARDITERKMLERTLQQQRNETEMLSNQQIAIITASAIAHELNSPLTAISAYSEVAQRTLGDEIIDHDKLRDAFAGCVDQVQKAGNKLRELLSSLQGNEVETEALNLNHVVEDALKQARGDGYGEFHLILELESSLCTVKANKIQIQRVLVNLIRNAVEAIRAQSVPVSEITIAVKTLANESMSMLTIKDNGPGIDRNTISRIFEPFFTTKPTGFGMGLSISRALIEANGGQLWVDPDFRQGAQFHFTLPFAS